MADITDSYARLPIGKYLEICSISKDEQKDELQKQVEIISILTDMEEDEILNLPIDKYKELVVSSRFLSKQCEGVTGKIAKEYKIGEWTLVPTTDTRKVTTSQYYDFQEYAKQGEDGLVGVLSCFLVPKGKTYNKDYDVVEVQDAIKEYLSVYDVLNLSAFFFVSLQTLIADSLTSLKREAQRIAEQERREMMLERIRELETSLHRGGDGLRM